MTTLITVSRLFGWKAIGACPVIFGQRRLSDHHHKQVTVDSESRERIRSLSYFYDQSAIDKAAAQSSVRLKVDALLYDNGKTMDKSHILRSAQYLHKELPVRIAHRIDACRKLPFIVGCNPNIFKVHAMYMAAFQIFSDFRSIETLQDEREYCEVVRTLLDEHKDVLEILKEGFAECQRREYLQENGIITAFLNRTLTSRAGIRMLCEHHLALHDEKPNHVGIINVNFSPRKLIEKNAEIVSVICQDNYGRAPVVIIDGHKNATFAYIPPPLDYILLELLKNAFRATAEFHKNLQEPLPPISVTIVNNRIDFIIRISDRGGGIPHNIVKNVWEYYFTTSGNEHDKHDRGLLGDLVHPRNRGGINPSKMHGYGFGLPASRAFVEYLGGEITLETMQGRGTDVYLRLRHIMGGQSFCL